MTARYEPVDSPDETTMFSYHDLTPPSLGDVYGARAVVEEYLPRTPLVRSEWLSDECDADVYLKREDVLPTGAFKVRGGLTLAASLDDEFRERGMIAASTGNHGQSVAYAGREFDVPVHICVPEDANPGKVGAMERLGATVDHHGETFDDARAYAEERAAEEGLRYVHSANEPDLVAGVATAGLEVIEDLPDVDRVYCPIGGGSGASGYCLTAGRIAGADVVGVQSEAAPAMYHAWRDDHLDPHDRMETFAEGVATSVPFALTTRFIREHLDDFQLVPDDAAGDALRRLYEEDHVLMEGACAMAVAALLRAGEELAGETVVVPVTGRNLSVGKLAELVVAP
jgi:threonine dehydratase